MAGAHVLVYMFIACFGLEGVSNCCGRTRRGHCAACSIDWQAGPKESLNRAAIAAAAPDGTQPNRTVKD